MKKIFTLYFFMLLFLSFGIQAQNVQNYVITAGSNESLIDDTAGWTTIIGGNQLNVASTVRNIGFETWFMGERFTQFSANTGGVLRFGSTALVGNANAPAIPGNARIALFGPSIASDPDHWRTENNGYVRYKLIGTAPNRTLVVDWVNIRMEGSASNNSGVSRFQAHVFETAPANTNGGVMKIIYGRMYIDSHAPTTGCGGGNQTSTFTGIGYGDTANKFVYINTDNHPTVTGTSRSYTTDLTSCNSFGSAPTNVTSLHSTTNGSRKYYNFNPPAPTQNVTFVSASCVSDNSLLINWTAPAGNQVGYVIYRATNIAGPYTFLTQTNTVTSSFLNTGLTAGTTYYYRVFTVTEGRLSALTPTNQVSATTTVSPTVFSVISNIWSSTTTWSTSNVPVAAENVVIGCPTPHTVTVNANGLANDLTIETGSVLNFNTGQTVTTERDVINKGTININNGTLRIKGNLINTAGATVNVGTGTLIVEGNFTNAATATLNGNAGTFALKGNFINEGIYNSATSIMRFDGNALQLINHTGTSSGQGVITNLGSYNNATALITPGTPAIPGTAIAIPDGNAAGVSQTLVFPATAQPITNVTLNLQINHTWVGDIIVRLTSPDGTTRTLIDRPGRVSSGFGCGGNDIDVLLSDAAALPVEGQCAGAVPTINGTFRPNETLAIGGASFLGEDPSGNWTITVSDNAGGDTGSLVSGSLNVTTASGTTSVLVNPGTPATPATPGLSIPDNTVGGVNHTINVPSAGTIQNVRMDIAIDHTYIGNLIVTLRSPVGTTRTMMTRVVNSGDCSTDNLSITFDDLAAASVQAQCGLGTPSINGTYQPSQSLAGFVGENQSGNWIINVADRAGGNVGRIMSANLYITTSVPVPFPLGANLYYHKLEMQNTNAGVRTQNTDIIVNNTATWTTGVFRADNDHMIIFPDNATSTVGNNASHADMKVRKIGNDAFDFPVGNAGWGAPIGITAPSDVADYFTAQYFKQITPTNFASKEATIHHVGLCEYWILDRKLTSAAAVTVTLSYDNVRSCTVGNIAGLKVIRWDGAIWRDHFQSGVIAAPYNGVVSLGAVTNFSPFTLGATFDNNVLPLTFLSFDAKPSESDAILDWTTTGELNHDYFEIERSINGKDFEEIGNVKNVITRDNTKNTYSFIDKNVGIENREAYYRLKQIDNDGAFSYSDIKKVNWSIDNSENEALFVAYPNPFTDILTLEFDLQNQENVEIVLMDMAGRTIKTISQSFSKGNHKLELNNLQNLAQGSYLIQLKTNLTQKTFKVVKM